MPNQFNSLAIVFQTRVDRELAKRFKTYLLRDNITASQGLKNAIRMLVDSEGIKEPAYESRQWVLDVCARNESRRKKIDAEVEMGRYRKNDNKAWVEYATKGVKNES